MVIPFKVKLRAHTAQNIKLGVKSSRTVRWWNQPNLGPDSIGEASLHDVTTLKRSFRLVPPPWLMSLVSLNSIGYSELSKKLLVESVACLFGVRTRRKLDGRCIRATHTRAAEPALLTSVSDCLCNRYKWCGLRRLSAAGGRPRAFIAMLKRRHTERAIILYYSCRKFHDHWFFGVLCSRCCFLA